MTIPYVVVKKHIKVWQTVLKNTLYHSTSYFKIKNVISKYGMSDLNQTLQ